MRIQCEDCGRIYDDEFQWTICPEHNPLEAQPHSGYCRKHDFFEPCQMCKIGETGQTIEQAS